MAPAFKKSSDHKNVSCAKCNRRQTNSDTVDKIKTRTSLAGAVVGALVTSVGRMVGALDGGVEGASDGDIVAVGDAVVGDAVIAMH